MDMKKQRALLILFCFVWSAAGCGNRYTEPAYSQEETLVRGEDSLSPHTGALVTLDTERLSSEQVVWGPGREMDAENRPTACVELQEKYGRYGAVFLTEEEGICLTFDEGYENGYTASILDTLREEQIPAVFFVTLDYVKKEPELVRRMIDEGHAVGNHTAYHPNMTQISLDKAQENIQILHDYVRENFDYTMTLFRNPEGAFSEQVLAMTQEMGYKSVLWSFAYNDWNVQEQPNPETSLKKLTDRMHPGAVYLLHAVSRTNDQILQQWIQNAKAAGYEFILLS